MRMIPKKYKISATIETVFSDDRNCSLQNSFSTTAPWISNPKLFFNNNDLIRHYHGMARHAKGPNFEDAPNLDKAFRMAVMELVPLF